MYRFSVSFYDIVDDLTVHTEIKMDVSMYENTIEGAQAIAWKWAVEQAISMQTDYRTFTGLELIACTM